MVKKNELLGLGFVVDYFARTAHTKDFTFNIFFFFTINVERCLSKKVWFWVEGDD